MKSAINRETPPMADGKMLEALVAFVEETLLPAGFTVTPNQRVTNDRGVPIAEFDIEIRGKVGTTDFAWLLECRDRPSEGPAGGEWIEQLVGRKDRFLFNKVTAVSTTGFTEGARDFAKQRGIELREVRSLDAAELGDWMRLQFMMRVERRCDMGHASINIEDGASEDQKAALREALTPPGMAQQPILKSKKTGQFSELRFAFLGAVETQPQLFDDVVPNGPAKPVRIRANYTNSEDHFVLERRAGELRIKDILFTGELRIIETLIPLAVTAEYSGAGDGAAISQYAAFAPFDAHDASVTVEFHRMAETGETHVVLRTAAKKGDGES